MPVATLIPAALRGSGMCRASPAEIPLLLRGDLATPGPKVGPGVPAFLTDAENRYQPKPPYRWLIIDGSAAGAGAVAYSSPARGRRHCWLACWPTESGSTILERDWRLRRTTSVTRDLPDASRAARVPGGRAGALGLERQGPSSPDRVFLGLPAIELAKSTGCHSSIPITACSRRFPLRRLDAEAIRDAMLAASGELDDRQGGPYVPTDRTGTGDVVVARRRARCDSPLGLSSAAAHPDGQPARGVRCAVDRHHLHSPLALHDPAAIALAS